MVVERRGELNSRWATFGLEKNGQIALREIAPRHVLRQLQDNFGIPTKDGHMLPWLPVRDALLRCVREESPYKEAISVHLGCVIKKILEEDENVPL